MYILTKPLWWCNGKSLCLEVRRRLDEAQVWLEQQNVTVWNGDSLMGQNMTLMGLALVLNQVS